MNTTHRTSRLLIPGVFLAIIATVFMIAVVMRAPYQKFNYLLTIAPPVIGICVMLYLTAKNVSVIPSVVALLFGFILICGNAYQVVLGKNTPAKIFLLNFLSLIGAGVSLTLYIKVIRKKVLKSTRGYRIAIYITAGMILTLLLMLLAFGSNINGARLWLSFGPFTLELTEIVKLLFCFLTAMIYNSNMDVRRKILYGAIAFGISSLLFALLNEFGSVIILFGIYLSSFYIHIRSRYSRIMIFATVFIMAIALAVIFGTHEAIKTSTGFFTGKLNKIYDRLVLADTDQVTRAIQGIINGGAFGSDADYKITYHSIEADFAPAGMAQFFGIIVMLLCVLAFAAIVYLVFLSGRDDTLNNRSRYKLSYILTTAIAVQALLSLAGNIGLPCAGVGMPGISAGGTQMLTFYIEVAFIIYGLKKDREDQPHLSSPGYARRDSYVETKI